MNEIERVFDSDAFYRAIATTVEAREITWKQASLETGVSATTLTRMAKGRKPDASSLAILATWAGLSLSDFVSLNNKPQKGEPLALATAQLRSDPDLSESSKDALEEMMKAAYISLRKKDRK
ncbi:hypothetical protein [Paraburkholderia aromaticivorans]|uniref:hypothetical protein n=1 Tax=Paraburkholderia aromaticivorans TaxID=2026199 RepID=UPI0014560C9B|nr:hypothetical protein [Paraburkholderia aromaticivorans]